MSNSDVRNNGFCFSAAEESVDMSNQRHSVMSVNRPALLDSLKQQCMMRLKSKRKQIIDEKRKSLSKRKSLDKIEMESHVRDVVMEEFQKSQLSLT